MGIWKNRKKTLQPADEPEESGEVAAEISVPTDGCENVDASNIPLLVMSGGKESEESVSKNSKVTSGSTDLPGSRPEPQESDPKEAHADTNPILAGIRAFEAMGEISLDDPVIQREIERHRGQQKRPEGHEGPHQGAPGEQTYGGHDLQGKSQHLPVVAALLKTTPATKEKNEQALRESAVFGPLLHKGGIAGGGEPKAKMLEKAVGEMDLVSLFRKLCREKLGLPTDEADSIARKSSAAVKTILAK